MKKILNILFTLLFSFLFMNNVFASVNANIKSLEIADKTSTIDVNSYSYEALGIKTDIFFNQVGDYVKFKIVLKNNDNTDYIISDIKSNYQNEYTEINYEYENDSKDFRANSEKTLFVTFKYKKEATDVRVLNATNVKLVIPLDTIKNPKTGIEDVSIILLVGIGIGLSVFLLVRRSPKMLVVLFAFTLIASTMYLTNAAQQLQIDLDVDVTMDTPTTGKAIFDKGINVIKRTYDLSGIDYESINENNTLLIEPKCTENVNYGDYNSPYYDPLPEEYYSCTNKILNYKRSESIEDKYKTDEYKVSSSESAIPIYMWYEEETKTIYWYSEAPMVYLNEDATEMFYLLAYVNNLDLSDIRTKNTKNFMGLFAGMVNIKQLDVSNLNTSNGENFSVMFAGMKNLESIDVSKFDVSNAKDFSRMFMGDRSLTRLDLSSWNNNNLVIIEDIFSCCINLKEIDISTLNFSIDNYYSRMFDHLPSLERIKTPKSIDKNVKIVLSSVFADDNNNYYGTLDSNIPASTWIHKTNLISFTIHDYVNCEVGKMPGVCDNAQISEYTMFAEPNMKWSEWIESKYNTLEVNFVEYNNYCSSDNEREKHLYPLYKESSTSLQEQQEIKIGVNYDDYIINGNEYKYYIENCYDSQQGD